MHLLFGGKVRAVGDVPDDEDGPHVAEHDAVEAECHYQREERQMHGLPDLEGHLRFFRSQNKRLRR